jgi:RNA polymerase sigma factor (sigma-70 family)
MLTQKEEIKQRALLATAHLDFEKGLNLHAFFKVNDHSVGEDLVQDTFVKTWKYLVKGGKIDIMKAFLYHVLNNLIIDQYRKHKTASLDALIDKGFDLSTGDTQNLFNVLDGKAAVLLIKDLPKSYQKVMRMRYIQELTLTEMAFITGLTKNTVAVHSHRGLEKLKILYNKQQASLKKFQ